LLASRKWSTATAAVVGYDGAKRPISIDRGALVAFDQAYDRDGNVTSESRSLAGVSGDPGTGTQSFTYDALNRVTGASGLAAGNKNYTYDLDGNRVTATEAGGVTATYVFDRTDQLVSVTPAGGSATVFGYDKYGNMTTNAESISSVRTMTYDLADKLTGIDASGTANDATFTFDALGRFKTRALSGSTDTYSYAGTAETVLRISNSSGPTVTDSIVSPSGDRLGIKVGSTLNWLVPELHGNVGGALDAAENTVVNAVRYDAYGETVQTGSGGGTAVGAANWKYQGRLDVSPSGLATPLYDMSARFYSPGLGTFTQLDSVMGSAQNPLSMNRFLYALANPATFIDPTGHAACVKFIDGACQGYHDQIKHGTLKPGQSGMTANWKNYYKKKNAVAEDRYTSRRVGLEKMRSPREVPWTVRHAASIADSKFRPDDRDKMWAEHRREVASGANSEPWTIHNALDVLGFVNPGADLANATAYASEGDWGNAILNGLAAIPLAGDALKGGVKFLDEIGASVANVAKVDPALARGADEFGGFAHGVSPSELTDLNRTFSNGFAYRDPSVVLANASRYEGFNNKAASIIRDIAGGHLYENGNKRTAIAVIELLIQRNEIASTVPTGALAAVVDRAAKGELTSVDAIAAALRGY
jgi:RHS repeat-associated protein